MKRFFIMIGIAIIPINLYAMYGDGLTDSQLVALAKDNVSQLLKDPDSAKFRNVKINKIPNAKGKILRVAVCGEINGKNSFNAYAGYSNFVVDFIGDKPRSAIDNGEDSFANNDYFGQSIYCLTKEELDTIDDN